VALEDRHEEERHAIEQHGDDSRPGEPTLQRPGGEDTEVEGEDGEFGEAEAELVKDQAEVGAHGSGCVIGGC